MAKQLSYAQMKEIFTRFHALEAEPKGELEHVNAFTLLVAVALSAQATDVGVNKATRGLFAVADTPAKMLALGEDGLIQHIKTIGLFRNKAKNVIKLCRILIDDFGGEVPSSRAALQSLPPPGLRCARRRPVCCPQCARTGCTACVGKCSGCTFCLTCTALVARHGHHHHLCWCADQTSYDAPRHRSTRQQC